MWRHALSVLCLGGCGYIGFGSQSVQSTDGGPDAAPAMCAARQSADYCASLPSLSLPPVIDGVVDCGLALQAFSPSGWYTNTNVASPPSNIVTRYAAGWREDGIYVYFEVDDPSPYPAEIVEGLLYCGDSAEIYIDTNGTFGGTVYDAPGTRQFLARALPQGATAPSSIGEIYAQQLREDAWRQAGFAVFPRPGGYVLEAFITAADMDVATWALVANGRVGFDLGVNVSSEDGTKSDCDVRIGQFFLRSTVNPTGPCFGRPYCDTSAFCTPTLAAP